MNTRRPLSFWIKWLLLIALVLGIALGVTRALGKRKATNEAAMAAAESLQKTPTYTLSPTDVVTVQNIELTQTIALSGSVDALQSAAIKAKTAGEIQGLSKREGDSVKAGEVVARIDSTEAQARVRQATRQAESAQAQVAIARRTFDNNQA
ncbi:biotin/lipoyl-binding protein, partial [Hydrogenophaga sp.]